MILAILAETEKDSKNIAAGFQEFAAGKEAFAKASEQVLIIVGKALNAEPSNEGLKLFNKKFPAIAHALLIVADMPSNTWEETIGNLTLQTLDVKTLSDLRFVMSTQLQKIS